MNTSKTNFEEFVFIKLSHTLPNIKTIPFLPLPGMFQNRLAFNVEWLPPHPFSLPPPFSCPPPVLFLLFASQSPGIQKSQPASGLASQNSKKVPLSGPRRFQGGNEKFSSTKNTQVGFLYAHVSKYMFDKSS